MIKSERLSVFRRILVIVAISLLGAIGIIFSVLYLETFKNDFVLKYSDYILIISESIVTILTVTTLTFIKDSKSLIYKLGFLLITCISITLTGLYILKISGLLNHINSTEKLRSYISSFEGYAILFFVLIQFLQVVVLPIPAFLTVGAGVLLFGPLKGAIYSCLGIIAGSILAYFIGRIFGFKVAKWLVGGENLNKVLSIMKGKDKLFLTFAFLFPFFPDDILCFCAGLTTISPKFFILMIVATRIISIFASSFSMNNNIIPYDTWWGILLWIIFFIITFLISLLICKAGDKFKCKSTKTE